MIEVIFPKRPPTPRELDTRPVPSDYRPQRARSVGPGGADSDGCYSDEYGDEPTSLLLGAGVNLHRFEDELTRNRLNEIATLVRTLTYGEMMQFAHAICKIRPQGTIDQQSLPMMLHMWSTSSPGRGAADGNAADGRTAEQ
jgi:hypothetical protein